MPMKTYTDVERQSIIRQIEERPKGESVEQAAIRLNVSLGTVYAWKAKVGNGSFLPPIDLGPVRTEDLIRELKKRSSNVIVGLQVEDGRFEIYADCERDMYPTLVMLLDLDQERRWKKEKKNDRASNSSNS